MSSKIKVDTIENVAGSGNVSLGSGHNLVVPGNNTVGGTLNITGASTLTGGVLTNTLNTASGTTITIPTGKTLVVTDTGGVKVPGSVIQMSNFASDFTGRTVTNGSYTEFTSALRATITPKYSTSKILIMGQITGSQSYSAVNTVGFAIYRDSTKVLDVGNPAAEGSNAAWFFSTGYSVVDSPSSTSALTYSIFGKSHSGSHSVYLNYNSGYGNPGTGGTTILALEIAQ
tara:strand:- start:1093 stop:1779 length:687 start_codon:yes stop_codon:yes gene_type:complete